MKNIDPLPVFVTELPKHVKKAFLFRNSNGRWMAETEDAGIWALDDDERFYIGQEVYIVIRDEQDQFAKVINFGE
jgi:hypothetical protein